MKLSKKNYLILGAGRIGHDLAIKLAQSSNVCVVDKNLLSLNKIKKKNPTIHLIKFKLNSGENFKKIINKVKSKMSKIDGVVYALYPKSNSFGKAFEKIDDLSLKEDLFYQIGYPILFLKEISKYFIESKIKGRVVLISSIQGISAPKFYHYKKTKMHSPIEYTAAKSALIMITRYLAKYFKGKLINFNCISPGGILDNQPANFIKKYKKDCMSKGLLDSKDILGSIVFLLSDESKFINGQNIIIDDGWSL